MSQEQYNRAVIAATKVLINYNRQLDDSLQSIEETAGNAFYSLTGAQERLQTRESGRRVGYDSLERVTDEEDGPIFRSTIRRHGRDARASRSRYGRG